jgi:hypothetical protein
MILSVSCEVDMAYLHVVLHNHPTEIRLKTDKVEEENKPSGNLLAKDAQGSVIGKFTLSGVAGWWISET